MRRVMLLCVLIAASVPWDAAMAAPRAGREEVIRIWPGDAPGSPPGMNAETSNRELSGENRILIVRNVSIPTLTVIRPAPGRANGTAMLVLPGGAFMALAWDLEGLEVAHWLAARGVTAFVLKYRVSGLEPGSPADRDLPTLVRLVEPKRKLAVADAAEAIALLRRDALSLGIDANRVGMIGFSAGAVTTLGVILEAGPLQRPDFAAAIYGMPMIDAPVVPANAPPLFLVHAQDDPTIPPQASTQMFDLWTGAKRPAELHIYAQGGHGFGMRAKGRPVDCWPAAFEAWMQSRGLLKPIHAGNDSLAQRAQPTAAGVQSKGVC